MTDAPTWREAIQRGGGVDAVAAKLGIKRRTLFLWRKTGVPAQHVLLVAEVTGIPAAKLRPDMAAAFVTEAA